MPRNPRLTPLPLSRSGSFKSRRHDCSAGTKPKIRTVSTATQSVNASTGPFSSITDSAGMTSCGIAATSNFSPPQARKNPSKVPPITSTRLSTISSRTSRMRPAPSVARRANSFSRDVARASIKFATLLQAIKRSNPTAPSTVYKVGLMRPTTVSPIFLTCTVKCAG